METSIRDQARVRIERSAEQAGIGLLQGESFTHILRLNQLLVERAIVDEDGTEVTLRGQDLVNAKTWERFLRQVEVNLSWLSYEAGGDRNQICSMATLVVYEALSSDADK